MGEQVECSFEARTDQACFSPLSSATICFSQAGSSGEEQPGSAKGAPPPTGPLRKLAPLGELNLISLSHLVGRQCARFVVCGVLRGVSIISESSETRRSSHSYNVCQHLS